MAHDQPHQLRLAYAMPAEPIDLGLSLSGLLVLVTAADETAAGDYLHGCGVALHHDEIHGTHFALADLPRLARLPDRARLRLDGALDTLWPLLVTRRDDGLAATVEVSPSGEALVVTWYEGDEEHQATLSDDAAAAFVQSSVAFAATPDAWRFLTTHSSLPVEIGVARLSVRGFVEIEATKPQLLEQVPPSTLRGMFSLGPRTFGVARAVAEDVSRTPGLRWADEAPSPLRGPDDLSAVPIELSAHTRSDLGELVERLATRGAQAVVWASGLGRRVFALSALSALDAWPLLIVTPPASVWAWQRHLDLLGRRGSLRHGREDAHLVTYRDLAKRHVPLAPGAIIFDGLASDAAARDPGVVRALHRLDGVLHAYRVAIDSTWPDDPDDSTSLLSLLRPDEFRHDVSVVARYPVYPRERSADHVALYLSRREHGADAEPHPFRRSSVVTVGVSAPQREAFAAARARLSDPERLLAELLSLSSSGPAHALSPKVVAAVSLALASGPEERLALVTRHERTAVLLAGLLRAVGAAVVDTPSPEGPRVAIVVYDEEPPDLRPLDHVIVLDYPWSFVALERAVGPASDPRGPRRVTCVHLLESIDDRVAMLAARRREFDSWTTRASAPDFVEVGYLLAP